MTRIICNAVINECKNKIVNKWKWSLRQLFIYILFTSAKNCIPKIFFKTYTYKCKVYNVINC